VWNARPENRQLPSLLQWLQIRWHTSKKNWTPPQRKMMGKAGKHHVLRAGVVAILLAVATVTALTIRDRVEEKQNDNHAADLVQAVLNADITQVKGIIDQMKDYRQWAGPRLRQENSEAAANSRQKLHTSLALLPGDASQVPYLKDRLLDAKPSKVPVIRDALAPHKDELVNQLWSVVEAPEKGKEFQRLRAAAALAKYDPENQKWAKSSVLVVNDLVRENAVYLLYWSELFRPVKNSFLAPLADIYRDVRAERAAERSLATNLLADYAADNLQTLADLLMDADEKQFEMIFAPYRGQGENGLALLTGEIDKKLPATLPSSDVEREKLAKRQANAAVALLRLGQPGKVWPLLKRSPPDDPRVRSYLIHRLSPLGADAEAILQRLQEEPDITIRRALLLSLGEFSEEQLPADARTSLLPKLKEIYGKEADPGLHAAVEWLLRHWKQEAWLKQMNEEWAKNEKERNQRIETIQQLVKRDKAKARPQWYVNSQGQTMVVIPGPVEFLMGSPPTEAGRLPQEKQHQRRIGRTFALAAKPVTVRDFRQFVKENELEAWFEVDGQTPLLWMKRHSPDEDCPMILVDWYRAAAYCNWLSQQDGIPEDQWCFETNARKLSQEKMSVYGSLLLPQHPLTRAANTSHFSFLLDQQLQVTALKKNYLSLHGYRLPTEAEKEYACRAGAVTSRYYGETDELLAQYGWYQQNSKDRTWPVGVKKPTDLGLFDMHGNVWNWCQENFKGDYAVSKGSTALEDGEDSLQIVSTNSPVLRGGSFGNQALYVRSAYRIRNVPSLRTNDVGFRPARTFTP
jgi:formylglycine-generating enzyme required for sulfatase activity